MRVSIKKFLILSFGLLLVSARIVSADIVEIWSLQTRLIQDGFYEGKLDGKKGPRMTEALRKYGQKHGVPGTIEAVANNLRNVVAPSEHIDLTVQMIEEAHKNVGKKLRDSESARYQNEYGYRIANDIYVCGEVNAKNAYGAFVGYQVYQVLLSSVSTQKGVLFFSFGDPLSEFSADYCAFGTGITAGLD